MGDILSAQGVRSLLKTSLTTAPAIANTETVVLSFTIPANTLIVGQSFAVSMGGGRVGAANVAPTMRVRIGPTTLTGAIAMQATNIQTANPGGWHFDGRLTVLTLGAAGTVSSEGISAINTSTTTTITNNHRVDTIAIDTTVANLFEMTLISGDPANTYTARNAVIVGL